MMKGAKRRPLRAQMREQLHADTLTLKQFPTGNQEEDAPHL